MIGILGGTFDPIHYGHLHIAQTLHHTLHLQTVRFIPCKNPVLGKKVIATATQRLTMLQRALEPYPYCIIDERELQRASASYTLDTLIALRRELEDIPLALILGSDQLAQFNNWHGWMSLIHYAHLVIVPRDDCSMPYHPAVQTFMNAHQVQDASLLSQQAAGFLFMSPVKPLNISATMIRMAITQGSHPTGLLPATVLDYILEKKLYL